MILNLRQLASKYGLPPLTRVLHIGGHWGEEQDDYTANGATDVTWVEPQFGAYCEMHRRIAGRPGVRILHTALGPYTGKAVMHTETANAGQSSSILAAKLHATQYPQVVFNGVELVTVMRCDDLFKGDVFDLIAIDVQGYEGHVLSAATETLSRAVAVSAEINREELYEGCTRVEELDALLGSLGFARVETEWCGGTWGEGIYVRRST